MRTISEREALIQRLEALHVDSMLAEDGSYFPTVLDLWTGCAPYKGDIVEDARQWMEILQAEGETYTFKLRQHNRVAAGNYKLPDDVEADVCIIAGDIAGRFSKMGRTWLEHQFEGMPIVVVPGNHCMWKASFEVEVDKFREALQVDYIHVLDGDNVILGDTRFVGGILWTDYAISGDKAAAKAISLADMNDWKYIRKDGGRGRARPIDLEEEHWRIRLGIDRELAVPFNGASVVVTHHAPHARSLRNGGVKGHIDATYASDMTGLITHHKPELWVHGHVHKPRDYVIDETPIVCNSRGYIRRVGMAQDRIVEREVKSFDPKLVIAVLPKLSNPYRPCRPKLS